LEHKLSGVDLAQSNSWSRFIMKSHPTFEVLENAGSLVEKELPEAFLGEAEKAKDALLARQLKSSEARYQSLFNSLDDGFCVIEVLFDEHGTAFDYRFLEINPAFERQSGLVNARGKTMRDFVPEHNGQRFGIYGRVAQTGEPIRFESRDDLLNRWFDIYAFRVDEPGDNRVAVLFRDISPRKREEVEKEGLVQQLEAERAKFAYLYTHAPAFVATLRGPDHIFELTNGAYLQLVGRRDVIGKPFREALPEIVDQGFIDLIDQVYRSGQVHVGNEVSVFLQSETGETLEEHFVDYIFQPMFNADGAVDGIFIHGFDVTNQVKARHEVEAAKKHAEEANRTKDDFLATLSHELRTPLTAIMGWTSILKSGRATAAEVERGLNTIERNAAAQAQLIEDILDVSRVITGKLRLEVQPVDLGLIIEEAVNTVLPAAQAKEVRLQRVIDAGASLVSGDPARLQQIIWNLLSNAIKFTPKGGKVQIRIERINSHIEVVVADDGQGIPLEMLPHIFDRFRQVDSGSTRTHGGLGLGLSIVRHLIELHGGSVEAHSEGLGCGASFRLELPLLAVRSLRDRAGDEERRARPASAQGSSDGAKARDFLELKGVRVLVADDQEDTRMFLALVLEQRGAEVSSVGSAQEAVAAIQEFQPHVLLSDIGMPGEDGYALIKQVRALPVESGGLTPAAALTAFARVEDRVKVLRSGFQIHLPKPVDSVELVSVVANLAGVRVGDT
jgi:PAS domain S-box-containing protein